MSDKPTREEAAAFWGIAENPVFPVDQRLKCALRALEYYGGLVLEEEEND